MWVRFPPRVFFNKMLKYKIKYLVTNNNSIDVIEKEYVCRALCKYLAWKNFLKNKIDRIEEHVCVDYLKTYSLMKKDIERI